MELELDEASPQLDLDSVHGVGGRENVFSTRCLSNASPKWEPQSVIRELDTEDQMALTHYEILTISDVWEVSTRISILVDLWMFNAKRLVLVGLRIINTKGSVLVDLLFGWKCQVWFVRLLISGYKLIGSAFLNIMNRFK